MSRGSGRDAEREPARGAARGTSGGGDGDLDRDGSAIADGSNAGPTDRAGRVHAAIEAWTTQLVDLGARNALLFFRDQRAGSLDLTSIDLTMIDTLLGGRSVRVPSLFSSPEVRNDVVRRLRRIRSRARESFEEQGVSTLYLGFGLATWKTDRTPSKPNAPVLLRPAVLTAHGAAEEDFSLALIGDMAVNPTLLQALEAEFGLEIDADALADRIDGAIDTRPELEAAFAWLLEQAESVPGLSIERRIVLGNFSFAKLPMVRDLAATEQAFVAHDLVAALAGDPDARRTLTERRRRLAARPWTPDTIPPNEEFLVLDADASQSTVVDVALGGHDLIVEGPPGTGKSQTIANLIATAFGHGKTVLFVAEKRAAIDAVLNRLRSVGLGDLVLDLHGEATRREIAEQFERALRLAGDVPAATYDEEFGRLADARTRLAASTLALHADRSPWGISAYEARERIFSAPPGAETAVRIRAEILDLLDEPRFRYLRAEMQRLAELHPFEPETRGSGWARIADVTAESAGATFESLQRVRSQVLPTALMRLARAAAETGLVPPTSIAGWSAYVEGWAAAARAIGTFGQRVFGRPDGLIDVEPTGAALAAAGDPRDLDPAALAGAAQLPEVDDPDEIRERRAMDSWQRSFPALFPTTANSPRRLFDGDLLAAYAPAARGLAGFVTRHFDARYRAARRRVRARLRDPYLSDARAYSALADAHRAASLWSQASSAARPMPRPPALLDEQVRPAFETLVAELTPLAAALEEAPGTWQSLDLDVLRARLDRLAAERNVLLKLPRIRERLDSLRVAGLEGLLDEMSAQATPSELFVPRLDFAWHRSVADRLEFGDPWLAAFDPGSQYALVEEFAAADRTQVEHAGDRIRRAYAERVVAARDEFPDEAALVVHQASLKRGHLPLRRLVASSSNVLLTLKPCWAMSPLMVSEVLPPDGRRFDYVVFDEASQVLPADAMPAIVRGERLVVAGDNHQLPPTTFFMSHLLDGEPDEDALADELASTAGFESILDAVAPLLERVRLRWHYRSRDDRLIAFSNRRFYEGALTTFPGVSRQPCIEHVLVPFRRRKDQELSSADEVREVVRLVLRHAQERPDESLGVIALGIVHAQRIDDALRTALSDRRDLDEFFAEDRPEPFFVKNLERVQGDEREAIILSIGYGRSSDGRLFYRFGPLNVDGGERRLNVAVTRARRRMTVVSSFSAADMDPARTVSNGARMLREYLAYAEGQTEPADRSRGSVEDAGPAGDNGEEARERAEPADAINALPTFERAIHDSLSAAGVPTVPLIGRSRRRIDFAATHPSAPDRYVLAVELDGPEYASIPTVRDRERLRREQLERLGWRHHRIWTAEWLTSRSTAVARVRAAYDAALVESREGAAGPGPAGRPGSRRAPHRSTVPAAVTGDEQQPEAAADQTTDGEERRPRGPRPDVPPRPVARSTEQLVSIVNWIESDGLERTYRELSAEALRELGYKAPTSAHHWRMYEAIDLARNARATLPGHALPHPWIPARWTRKDVVELVAWIQSDTLLRTDEEIVDACVRELGVRRRTHDRMEAIRAGVRAYRDGVTKDASRRKGRAAAAARQWTRRSLPSR